MLSIFLFLHFTIIMWFGHLSQLVSYLSVLMTFVGQFNIKADMLMDRLQSFADGKTAVKLFTEFNHATLDAIAQVDRF